MMSLESVCWCEGVCVCVVLIGVGESATDPEFCASGAFVCCCSEDTVVCGLSVVTCGCACFLEKYYLVVLGVELSLNEFVSAVVFV